MDFGLARGFGALGWGVSAIFIGLLISHFTPKVIGYVYMISAIVLFSLLVEMDDLGIQSEREPTKEKEKGVVLAALHNRTFLVAAVGLLLCLIGHAVSGTYSINIVKSVGGSETELGFVQFLDQAAK